ncbi:MAG: acyl-CoA dehydrogenase family protein [Hyphomonadaceae bacterium]|nr:acyl-CoA dehydrogenase family protein [Hyphomonadaceae bacterium]
MSASMPLRASGHAQFQDGAAALARARTFAPQLQARAKAADERRGLARETIDELLASGLFGIVTPKLFGGSELGFADLVRITAELASSCPSTGWVYGVLAGHSWLLNLFPAETQHEILGNPEALTATVFRLAGEVTEEKGGYRLRNGDGRFCSGIDFAQWVIVGNAVKKADGSVEPRFFVVPKSDIEVVDDWHTIGMRGTGSRSIRIADAFIPAHRSCSLSEMLSGASAGAALHKKPIYRMPFGDLAPFSIIGAPLGMARGAANAFAKKLGESLGKADALQVAEQSARLARFGEAAADIDAAFELVVADAAMIDNAPDPSALAPIERARIPRDWAWAAQRCRYAVTSLFEAAGGTAIYEGDSAQRLWRDVNASAQHFAFTWDTAMPGFGRAAAGLKPAAFALRGKS